MCHIYGNRLLKTHGILFQRTFPKMVHEMVLMRYW